MAKPTTTYPWATGASATLEPDAGSKVSGFVANDKPPARWHNWLFNGASKWHAYLDNLHNETDYLSKAYAWTGAHRFASTLRLAGTTNEVEYSDAAGVVTPRLRSVQVPMSSFMNAGGSGTAVWAFNLTGYIALAPGWLAQPSSNSSQLRGDILVPTGSELKRATFRVASTGVAITIGASIWRRDANGIISTVSNVTQVLTAGQTGTFNLDYPAGAVISGQSDTASFSVTTTTGTGEASLASVLLSFTDPGPRNF